MHRLEYAFFFSDAERRMTYEWIGRQMELSVFCLVIGGSFYRLRELTSADLCIKSEL